uniref:Uncharacterized protein n=1 Tax=Zea mays TaxID=4577 RepID=A0A804LQD9_MAIZE
MHQYAWTPSCGLTTPSVINALAPSSALRCQGCRPGLLLPLQPRLRWSSTPAAAGSPHPVDVSNLRLDVVVPCTQYGSSPSVPTTTSARYDLSSVVPSMVLIVDFALTSSWLDGLLSSSLLIYSSSPLT